MKLLGRRKRGKPLKRFMCVVKEDTGGWCDKRILVKWVRWREMIRCVDC